MFRSDSPGHSVQGKGKSSKGKGKSKSKCYATWPEPTPGQKIMALVGVGLLDMAGQSFADICDIKVRTRNFIRKT